MISFVNILKSHPGKLLSEQITEHFRKEIMTGVLTEGTKLPTCKEASEIFGVAAQTVNRAYDVLLSEGLVRRRRSVGTIVCRKGTSGGIHPTHAARQRVLPICHVARLETVSTDESDLIMDYLNGFTDGFSAWKCRFEIVHLREGQSDLDMMKKFIEARRARGLIVQQLDAEAMSFLARQELPMVFVSTHQSSPQGTSVMADHVGGYREAWNFAGKLGHREAAFLGFQNGNYTIRLRECSAGRELAETDGQLTADVCVPGPFQDSDDRLWMALEEKFGSWRDGRGNWPTLIFAATDVYAARLLRVLRSRGIEVPQDISIIGFNDAAIARHTDPPLTTLAKPRFQMGLAASRLLLDLLSKRPAAREALQTFPVRLLERETCASPRQK